MITVIKLKELERFLACLHVRANLCCSHRGTVPARPGAGGAKAHIIIYPPSAPFGRVRSRRCIINLSAMLLLVHTIQNTATSLRPTRHHAECAVNHVRMQIVRAMMPHTIGEGLQFMEECCVWVGMAGGTTLLLWGSLATSLCID